jgi:hypothetical protein
MPPGASPGSPIPGHAGIGHVDKIKVKYTASELYPVYEVEEWREGGTGRAKEIPVATFEKWKRVMQEFEEVQSEMTDCFE